MFKLKKMQDFVNTSRHYLDKCFRISPVVDAANPNFLFRIGQTLLLLSGQGLEVEDSIDKSHQYLVELSLYLIEILEDIGHEQHVGGPTILVLHKGAGVGEINVAVEFTGEMLYFVCECQLIVSLSKQHLIREEMRQDDLHLLLESH